MPIDPSSLKARPVRAHRVGAVVFACLLSVGVLSACGSKSSKSSKKVNLDTARVARSIEQSIVSQRHLSAKVSCPAAVPQEAGRKFECVATTPNPKHPKLLVKTPFEVTIQNAHGYVTYVSK